MCVRKLIHPLKPVCLVEKPFVWLYLPTGVWIKWEKKCFIKSVYTCVVFIHVLLYVLSLSDHEIFSTVILALPLIQEGQLSVSGERMCTSTGHPLGGLSLPRKKYGTGKLTALDMTLMGWLGCKTSTQTKLLDLLWESISHIWTAKIQNNLCFVNLYRSFCSS